MPMEGHSMDCECGCCDVEEDPRVQAQKKNVCPSCGKEMPESIGTATDAGKCPICGVRMQPGN